MIRLRIEKDINTEQSNITDDGGAPRRIREATQALRYRL
jgi:hypothetical protein